MGSIHYTLDKRRSNTSPEERKNPPVYDINEEFSIQLRYLHQGKKLNLSSGVKCSIKNFNGDYHLNSKREPVLKSDKNWREKNKQIRNKTYEIQSIVSMLDKKGIEPTGGNIKSQMREIEIERNEKSYTDVHLFVLFEEFTKYINGTSWGNSQSYTRTMNVSIKRIKEYITEYELKNKFRLLVRDIDDEWMDKFVIWCSKTENIQPITIRKRCKTLVRFGNWCRDRKQINHTIRIPKGLKSTVPRKPLYLTNSEIIQLWNFKEFDLDNPKHPEHLKYNVNEIEYITDYSVKKGRKPNKFTNWEVYKDMMVFLCNTGMRYGDMIKMKWENFEYKKNKEGKDIRNKGFLVFNMEKTNREVILDVNRVVMEIMIKYIKNKSSDDYIFPRNKFGGSISNQTFNFHIKRICEKVGFMKRKVRKPMYSLGDKVIEGSDRPVPIYKLVSSHLGRKSYIKRMVQLKVPYERIKQQTGHHSTRVFESYFSYDKEMVEGVNDSIFSDDITITKSKDTPPPKEILSISEMDKNLDQYKTWFDEGKIDEEEYKKLRGKILNLS